MASFRSEGYVYACSPIGADDIFNVGLTRVNSPEDYVKSRYKGAFELRLLARCSDVRAAELEAHARLAPYLVAGQEIFRVPDFGIVEAVFKDIEKDSCSDRFIQNLELVSQATGKDLTYALPKVDNDHDQVRWLNRDAASGIAGPVEIYSALVRKKALLLEEMRSLGRNMENAKQEILGTLIDNEATALRGDKCIITLSQINHKPSLSRRAISDILRKHPIYSSESDNLATYIFDNNTSRKRTDLSFREMPC